MKIWNEFSCLLKPSNLGGVGVFAAEDFSIGTPVFTYKFPKRKMKTQEIPPEFQKYCIYINDEECFCPERFDRMEIGWFLNHSHTPNIAKQSEGLIIAIKNITAGEEIFIDYNQLNEPEHLKEAYYKQHNK